MSFLVRSLEARGMTLSWFQRYRYGKSTFHRRANQSWLSKICNHFADIAAWSRKSFAMLSKTCAFGKKRPLAGRFWKFRPERIHHLASTSCVQISWNLADQKSVKSCVIYRTAPKICQGQRQIMQPKLHPNRFTSVGVIAERVNTIQTRHKVFPILGEASASSPSKENTTVSL